MRLSIIVPVLNESAILARSLATVVGADGVDEVIVVDGGSSDDTRAIAAAVGAQLLTSERGRGLQMNAGAAAATGELLLFLHADTELPLGFAQELRRVIEKGAGWGRFDLRFDQGGLLLGLIAWLISRRSRLTRCATGDQAIFVRRELFESVGGYTEGLLFEDVALCRRLKHLAVMGIPQHPVVTSSRRWRRAGTLRTSLLMWGLKLLYLAGFPSPRLARFYRDVR